mmetsp:Transcript_48937/g.36021  ORF Transcript_48937/g.36021 Transcript_48937/m.36021 type:complete len:95 (+) Transcript_48937:1362-1646(+)
MDGLSWITVPKAGHFVPTNYFISTKNFLGDFIGGRQLECKRAEGCDLVEVQCKYMNDCNGNGDCSTGFCICNQGFTGADCSQEYTKLTADMQDF